MANNLKLWISPETGRLLNNSQSFVEAEENVFFFGNTLEVELHQMMGVAIGSLPFEVGFPAGATVKLAIGLIEKPTSGTWTLTVGANTTAALDFDATPSEVASALNALASVTSAGGVSVSALGQGYSITWNTVGTKPDILPGADTLVPAAYESIYTLQEGSATNQEIVFVELRQSPIALADSFSAIPAPTVSVTTVSPWNGSNKVVRTAISSEPKEGFFTFSDGTKTAVINAFATAGEYKTALAVAGISAQVVQSGELQFDITLSANSTITVDGSGLIASPGLVGTLNLATPEIIAFLGSETGREAILEITIQSGSDIQTVIQSLCLVASGVLMTGAVSPVTAGTILTESVANARFVRRDAAQSPTSADLDVIWPNLGVTADGSDVAAAISGANAPASGNVFATMADLGVNPFDQSLNKADSPEFHSLGITGTGITFPDSTTQTTAAVFFDQSLNSTDTVNFGGASIDGLTIGTSIQAVPLIDFCGQINFTDSTTQTTAAVFYDQSLNTTDSPSFEGLSATGGNVVFDDISSTYQFKWDATGGVAGVYGGATPIVTLNNAFGIELHAPGGTPSVIKYSDATTQESAPVYSAGTVIHSGGGGHIDSLDYPDEIRIVIGGVTYAMPARIV